ncbi:MAG: hypothetical protein DI535_05880 [Citrobacter freundii]|nr:MAG: hypothetical protein DI535_05880 [Citrobacter freundii]
MKKYFSFFVASALWSSCLQAQSDPNAQIVRDSRVINPVPPTPEMANLGKFGNITFEKSQGVASHAIPIHTIKYDGVSIPLELQYSSSGFRPSDPGSYLGAHWMLNGVGGISRQIKGETDENGYLLNSVNQAYVNQARIDADSYAGQSSIAQFNNGIDISQDIYTISTAGLSGRFFINAQKQFDFSVKTGNKLTYSVITGSPYNSIKFWITDTKGNKYEFSEEERTTITSQNGYNRTSVAQDGVTSWKLSKITTASGKEILFAYTQYNFSYNNPSQDVFMGRSVSNLPPDPLGYCGCSQTTSWKYGTNSYYFQSKLLTSITTANETVEFTYTDDPSASYYQKKLTAIQVKDFNGTVKKKFDFTFGYYNGGNRLKLTEFKSSDPSDANNFAKYGFSYYEDYVTPGVMSRSIDAYGYFNGASNTHLIVSGEADFPGPSADRSVNPLYAQQTLLKELIYPTKGKTKFIYEANGDVAANNLGAGLRVKELVNYNDNSMIDRRVFVYRQYQGPRLLLNNVPYNVYTEYSIPDNSACKRMVLTSDNQYGEIQNTIPVPTDFYYKEVDELVKGSVNDIKTTFKYAAQDSMMVGDQQIRPAQELQYKYEGGTFVLIKEKLFEYETTGISAYPNQVFQFAVNPGVLTQYVAFTDGGFSSCVTYYGGGGIAQSYPRYRATIRLKKITNKDYQGANYLQTATELTYGNSHEFPRYIKTTDSKGVTIEKALLYPTEASVVVNPSLTSPQISVFNGMTSKNMLDFVIAEEVRRGPNVAPPGSNIIDGARTVYGYFNSAYYLPEEIYDRQKDGTYYRTNKVLGYDANGNMLSSQKESGYIKSYVWDAKGIYPIAEVINAPNKDIFHTSFEDADGNSTAGDCKAGKKSRTGGYTKSLTGLTNGSYTLSYWQKSGSNWILQSSTVSVSAGSYTISLSGQVDDIRFHPAVAKMVTYTYEPLIGMLSQADIKNQYSYYEYDGIGRLVLTRDENKNVLKKFCYNYNGQPEACPYIASSQWQATGLTRCQPCPGSPANITNIQEHQEKDMNPSSPTYNTFRWVSDGVSGSCVPAANWQNTTTALRCQLSGGVNTGYQEQEQRDMNPCSPTYNQTRWIQGSYNTTACPPYVCSTANCSGNDKKCINNVCVTGTLVCVSSVKINKTTWQCTWRYCFSDGSLSTYSTTTNSTSDCLVFICGI